jgi:hypothetical protein
MKPRLNTNDFSQSPPSTGSLAENDRGAGVTPSPTGPNPLEFPHTCRDCRQIIRKPYHYAGRELCSACLFDATNPGADGLYAQLERGKAATA